MDLVLNQINTDIKLRMDGVMPHGVTFSYNYTWVSCSASLFRVTRYFYVCYFLLRVTDKIYNPHSSDSSRLKLLNIINRYLFRYPHLRDLLLKFNGACQLGNPLYFAAVFFACYKYFC